MGRPTEHLALIQRTGFPIPTAAPLDDRERGLLARYGYWLHALASGALAPTTPEQQQFVRVAHGEAEPQSAFEVAWVKCRQATAPLLVGPLEVADRLGRLSAARAIAATVREEYTVRRAAILALVRSQLDALDAEFAARLADAGDEEARREAEAREAVLSHGASFKHAGVHAVYTRGRVTWDSKGLAQYLESHPEVGQFRRVGAPSVSLRFLTPEVAVTEPVALPAPLLAQRHAEPGAAPDPAT